MIPDLIVSPGPQCHCSSMGNFLMVKLAKYRDGVPGDFCQEGFSEQARQFLGAKSVLCSAEAE